ncbi:hypothetical protein DYB35_006539 [Aphanomyces astaci]|uniref:ABC transmembrane type-1 domain-containing protein n=2 Tax=Aphanomyces astaci TaxID=112090 RepID=A0A418DJ53_APHAT|nr:hypothetical protein DYB35_006539 [Aphanomyces astaci]
MGTTKDVTSAASGSTFQALASPALNELPTQWSQRPHPIVNANWFSRALLLWFDPLVLKGAKDPLTEDDVWHLAPPDTAAVLQARFQGAWTTAKQTTSSPSFFRALLRTFRRDIGVVLALYTASSVLILLQPVVIKSLLQFLTTESATVVTDLGISNGYILAALLTLLSFGSVTIMDLGMVFAGRLGCNAKAIVMDLVFLHSLSGHQPSTSSGDLVTLASVDSTRLFMCGLWFMWTFLSPVMVLVIFVMIGFDLGAWPAIAGAAVMVALMAFGVLEGRAVGAIQKDILVVQGERVKFTNELLQGVRAVKMYGWEAPLQAHVEAMRGQELSLLKAYHYRRQVSSIALLVAPVLSLALCLVVYVAQGSRLTPPLAFITLAYVNAARTPCSSFSFSIMNLFDALHSSHRIDAFLASSSTTTISTDTPPSSAPSPCPAPNNMSSKPPSTPPLIHMQSASFQWTKPSAEAVDNPPEHALKHINIVVDSTPSLTIVVGYVGSGKSSLLSAMLGDLHLASGGCHVTARSVGYCSQDPWLQNATIRDNIVFTDQVDNTPRYNRVMSACHLEADLASLAGGDSTEIGARGVTLSGGQKARVGLARAAYKDADLYLLDDPLSALDAAVATTVFHECIRNLLSRTRPVVLVVNSHYHLLPFADRVLVMDNGAIVGDGPLESLASTAFLHLFSSPLSSAAVSTDSMTSSSATSESTATIASTSSTSLVVAEERKVGHVTSQTYLTYFQASGWNGLGVAMSVLVVFVLAQACLVLMDWFVGFWASSSPFLTTVPSNNNATYAGIYVALSVLALGLVLGRSLYVLHFILLCSKHLHAAILHNVLHAPVPSFFDVTPVGRILNRFSADLSTVDNMVPMLGLHILGLVFQIVASLVVCAATSPYILLLYVPLGYVFSKLRFIYSLTSTQLKRLDATSRSPVLNLLTETTGNGGGTTIRAFHAEDAFQSKARAAIDCNQRFDLTHFISTKWFQMRLDWVSVGVVGGVAFLAVATKHSMGDVTAAGLALTYAIQLTIVLSRTTMEYTYMENVMTSAERLDHYNDLEKEGTITQSLPSSTIQPCPGHETALADWPSQGAVTFANYSMRYRAGLELSLKHVSLSVRAGEKVGICGRTGGGKSSLLAALFRTVEAASGRIMIDGVDIATVDLSILRSRLTIIPQDPVVFSGSVRFNLDPTLTTDDAALWHVLRQVHLADVVGLDYDVAEHGANLSGGQRQLLCIARALLRKSKVVVLDEATANIDGDTDRLIQDTLRANFHHDNVTKLVIAHRVHTILDSDRILVLQNGSVVEFDTPAALLAIENGVFKALAAHAGATLP